MHRSIIRASNALCLALTLLLSALAAHAQNDASNQGPHDENSVRSFVDSVAEMVYKLAWPTATYRTWDWGGIDPADGGFDVAVKLTGTSAFDNSDLWVKLVLVVRDGGLKDIRVGENNAMLVQPFATSRALASAVDESAQQYAASQNTQPAPPAPYAPPAPTYPSAPAAPPAPYQPAPAPYQAPQPIPSTPMPDPNSSTADGVCLTNGLNTDLAFSYRWGQTAWVRTHIAAGARIRLWWPLPAGASSSPMLTIRYDDDFAPGYTGRDYDLRRTPITLPVACDRVPNYQFTPQGTKVFVYDITGH